MPFRVLLLLLLLLSALLLTDPAAAQVNLRLEQRVRITAPAAGLTQPTTGTVVGFRGDSVLLQLRAAQVQVPMGAISRIERSRGRSHVWTGVAGALIGGAAGYGAAKIADKDPW
ncbi:MAG TPA: hypothetical protein VHG93_14550, partial [Longimicrobium sp.]|nr:hypothetical protein [Longimicrobium sp.]